MRLRALHWLLDRLASNDMSYLEIILYLVIAAFCVYMAVKVHKRNKCAKSDINTNEDSVQSNQDTCTESSNHTIETDKEESNTFNERREIIYSRYQDLVKQKKAHAVSSFLYACLNLEAVSNLYELEKVFRNYDDSRRELLLMGDSEFYVKAGINLYNKMRKEGIYTTRRATIKNDAHLIIEHKPISDKTPYIIQACNGFESYWDGILNTYKHQSARLNRIDYLIDCLDDFSQKSFVKDSQEATHKVLQLRQKYIDMRDHSAPPCDTPH